MAHGTRGNETPVAFTKASKPLAAQAPATPTAQSVADPVEAITLAPTLRRSLGAAQALGPPRAFDIWCFLQVNI